MQQINSHDFESMVLNECSLVYITATWCGPCKSFSPIVSEVSELYKEKVSFGKLDADQNSDKLEDLGVKALPTVIIYKEGVEKERFSGLVSKQKLVNILETLLAESGTFSSNEDF